MGIFQSTRHTGNNLGEPTSKKFLKGIIKDGWKETVYERDEFWAVSVSRNEPVTEDTVNIMIDEFSEFIRILKSELGDNVISVDTEDALGTYFIVYLKK